jgi:hypothetical protein
MPQLTACPVGEILPIAVGVCPPGALLDPSSGCCILPGVEGVLEIPSVYPPPTPTPVGVGYTGSPYAPRGLPPTVAGTAAGGGFYSAIAVLVALIPSFLQFLNKPPSQTCPQCPDGSVPSYPNCACPQSKQCPAGDTAAPCGTGYVPDPAQKNCCKPAPGTMCSSPEFPPPCRPTETIDAKTGCCLPTCPAGEYEQPCRPNEVVDPATNCCKSSPVGGA